MRWWDLKRRNVRLIRKIEVKLRPGGKEGQSQGSGQGGGLGGNHWSGWPHNLDFKRTFWKTPQETKQKSNKIGGKILAARIIYQDKVLEQNELVWLVGELLRGPHRSFDTLGKRGWLRIYYMETTMMIMMRLSWRSLNEVGWGGEGEVRASVRSSAVFAAGYST